MIRACERSIVVEGESLVVTVPITVTRRQGRREIITPGNEESSASVTTRTSASLALTIARAHRWRELLEEGRFASIRELALALGVDNSYLARILRLTLLASDIVEAILLGTEPSGLSLGKLFRAPMDWEGQRRALGSALRQ
jgi:hypothetical protein